MRNLITYLSLFSILLFIGCNNKPKETRVNPRNLSDELINIDSTIWASSFYDLEGNEAKLSDFKGKVVLVDFWETWCGPCLAVFPTMDSLKKMYPDDFEVLAVNLQDGDTPEDVKAFMEKYDYDFHFLLDSMDVGSEVIPYGIPFKVFFDPNGYLVRAEVGTIGVEGDYQKAKAIIDSTMIQKN